MAVTAPKLRNLQRQGSYSGRGRGRRRSRPAGRRRAAATRRPTGDRHDPLLVDCEPSHRESAGPSTRTPNISANATTARRGACERDEAPPDEAAGTLTLIDAIQGPNQVLHRAAQRPDREHTADAEDRDAGRVLLGHPIQAVPSRLDAWPGMTGPDLVDENRHVVWACEQSEQSERDQERRRDRQERVVHRAPRRCSSCGRG